MKKLILILVLLFCPAGKAVAQFLDILKLSVDNNYNVNMIGTFQDFMIFPNTTISTGAISPQFFVAHLDSNFNVKWYKIMNSYFPGYDFLDKAVVTDKYGNLYIGGHFENYIKLDAATNLYADQSVFLAKYDTSGNLLWYRNSSGITSATEFSLGIDSQSNVYFSASAYDWVSFGTDTLFMTDTGAYVTKFDSAGNHLWFAELPGTKRIFDFQTDPSGNSFTVGSCNDTQYCGPDTLYAPGNNTFITKCSPAGVPVWQRLLTTGSYNTAYAVGVGGNGKPVITGSFSDSLRFNSLPTLLSTGEDLNKFIAHYDADGNESWAIRASNELSFGPPAPGQILPFTVNVDTFHNFYCSGWLQWSPLSLDTFTIPYPNNTSYIVKFDTAYNVLCSIGVERAIFLDVSLAPDNSVYVSGKMKIFPSSFSSGLKYYMVLNNDTIQGPINPTYELEQHFFLARFDQNCSLKHVEIIPSRWQNLEDVPDISNRNKIKVYPNPTSGDLLIDGIESLTEYRLMNLTGMVVQKGSFDKGTNTLNIRNVIPGSYLLYLVGADGSRSVARVMRQ